MPPGDSTRAWFPEMLEELEKRWNMALSWEECSALCDRMTEVRAELRRERDLKGPKMFCRHCNEVHEMSQGRITIRSLLFALRKRGLLTDRELKEMDERWRRHRSEHRLDGCGKKRAEPVTAHNAGIAPQLAIARHRPGVCEFFRWAQRKGNEHDD